MHYYFWQINFFAKQLNFKNCVIQFIILLKFWSRSSLGWTALKETPNILLKNHLQSQLIDNDLNLEVFQSNGYYVILLNVKWHCYFLSSLIKKSSEPWFFTNAQLWSLIIKRDYFDRDGSFTLSFWAFHFTERTEEIIAMISDH